MRTLNMRLTNFEMYSIVCRYNIVQQISVEFIHLACLKLYACQLVTPHFSFPGASDNYKFTPWFYALFFYDFRYSI